ncbi:MAG: prephenate dehydratase [Parvularculaceae bacterium]|nr:prephenate dehydratase [Parvularculaceae bacterium]
MTGGAGKIAFQGEFGAFSDEACRRFAPGFEPIPCPTFEAALDAVRDRRAERAMLPVENSIAGRVADIHHLLPEAGLHIVAEHFMPVRHQLLGRADATLSDIRSVRSHVMALGQCRQIIAELKLRPEISGDTAGAARRLAEEGRKDEAAIASARAAELYGLKILRANVEDSGRNTTRFLEMAREPFDPPSDAPTVTSFVFQVRNIPAALYKALGGFATNGVNMTKLESYMVDGSFAQTMFYADIEGHPQTEHVRRAIEELSYFSTSLRIIGVYPAARARNG